MATKSSDSTAAVKDATIWASERKAAAIKVIDAIGIAKSRARQAGIRAPNQAPNPVLVIHINITKLVAPKKANFFDSNIEGST